MNLSSTNTPLTSHGSSSFSIKEFSGSKTAGSNHAGGRVSPGREASCSATYLAFSEALGPDLARQHLVYKLYERCQLGTMGAPK
jgi:hypothetical protein